MGDHAATAAARNTLGPVTKAAFMAGERVKAQLARYTIRRVGTPDDKARMALFLCSDAAGWITGQTCPVNGGYSFAV